MAVFYAMKIEGILRAISLWIRGSSDTGRQEEITLALLKT
jgi:hypothetical protein